MRSREGAKRPCTYCGTLTAFELEELGPRGAHLRWQPCCIHCGEEPARRARLDKTAVVEDRDSRREAPLGSPDRPPVATERTQASQLSFEETT